MTKSTSSKEVKTGFREKIEDGAWLGSFMCAGLIGLIASVVIATVAATILGPVAMFTGLGLAVLSSLAMLAGAIQIARLSAAEQARIAEARKKEAERTRKIALLNSSHSSAEPIGVVEPSRTHDVAI